MPDLRDVFIDPLPVVETIAIPVTANSVDSGSSDTLNPNKSSAILTVPSNVRAENSEVVFIANGGAAINYNYRT